MKDNNNLIIGTMFSLVFWVVAVIMFLVAHFTTSNITEVVCVVFGIIFVIMGVIGLIATITGNDDMWP